MMKSAKNVQQMFAENSGFKDVILWDLFTYEDIEALKTKLKILFPDNDVEIAEEQQILNDETNSRDKRRKKLQALWKDTEKYNKKMLEKRELLMENIWTQRKYSNGDLLTTTIFVICTPNITDDSVQLARSQYSTEFSCHPLIRIRKCFVENESENCCMIFVDENGRVYQNWKDYIENNTLPEGVLVVPKNGIYDFTEENEVILEFFRTPACSGVRRALGITDTTSGVVGMAAATVPLTALFLPIAAPLILGAEVIGGAAGLWSIGRTTANLVDRKQQDQNITVGNSIVEIILKARDDEDVNALDVLQLGASLILFTHSIYNFRYVTQIVEKTHDGKINNFRKELSNRQRKMFNKMYKETIRIKGQQAGKVDVIRSIAKIPDKQYFNDIFKINRALNDQNVPPSLSGVANSPCENYLQNLREIPHSYTGNENSYQPPQLPINENVAFRITILVGSTIQKYFVSNESNLRNCFEHLYENLTNDSVEYLLEIAQEFVSTFLDGIESRLHRVIPFEQVLWDLFEISARLHGTKMSINTKFLREHIQLLLQELNYFYEKNIREPIGQPIKCKICKGFYRISRIF